ncbi:protein-L-isoaspartate O-methyltransferase family protein [Streptomyces sp. 1331.2]|uniref:protein-L-isoaspartate O-methyltransferase family protein n=1 Tax=Streptomyces sp. 1331.2 TaxID=1938835 RepID=UPI00211BDEC4|nr:methyltransferase domain-containing protein [Streptomyces sp. 1331.2]
MTGRHNTAALDAHRAGQDAAMAQDGAWPADSPWVREAMAVLPRDRFAPDRLWRWDGRAYEPLDRATDPRGWAEELYGGIHAPAVTRLDTGGLPSSSLSAPAVVADMLDSLLLEPGHRVWDIGAGQGWTTALAVHRAGPRRVVATELDAGLAEFARRRLAAAGADAEVLTGDATRDGPPGGRPVDRIHAGYAVEAVPWGWVEAVRPGGRIVYPWGRLGHVALTRAEDGRSAAGWVQGLARFMADRTAPAPAGRLAYAAVRGDGEPQTRSPVDRDPAPLADDWHLRFAIRVAVPDAVLLTGRDQDGVNAWIHDGDRSWAALTARGDGTALLFQGGPRPIGDEVLTAWSQWDALGRPSRYDYGITVTPDRQWAWLHTPDGPHWPIGVCSQA